MNRAYTDRHSARGGTIESSGKKDKLKEEQRTFDCSVGGNQLQRHTAFENKKSTSSSGDSGIGRGRHGATSGNAVRADGFSGFSGKKRIAENEVKGNVRRTNKRLVKRETEE